MTTTCTFPGCTGRFNADLARLPGHTGWEFDADESDDIAVHDHTTEEQRLFGRPLSERVAIEMTVEQWGLVAMVLEDANDGAVDDPEERDAIAAVEAIIDMAMSQT